MDLVGKVVRWEWHGEWFTARVTGRVQGDSYRGVVVDPGNRKVGVKDNVQLPEPIPYKPGELVPNLLAHLCTVIDSEPVTDDEECE